MAINYKAVGLGGTFPFTYRPSPQFFMLADSSGKATEREALEHTLSLMARTTKNVEQVVEAVLGARSLGGCFIAGGIQGTTLSLLTVGDAAIYHFPKDAAPSEITRKEEQTMLVVSRRPARDYENEPTVIIHHDTGTSPLQQEPIKRYESPLQQGDRYLFASGRLRDYVDLIREPDFEGMNPPPLNTIREMYLSRGAEEPISLFLLEVQAINQQPERFNPRTYIGGAALVTVGTVALSLLYSFAFQEPERKATPAPIAPIAPISIPISISHLCREMDQPDSDGEKDGIIVHQEAINWAYELARQQHLSGSRTVVAARATDILQEQFKVTIDDLAKERWKVFSKCE